MSTAKPTKTKAKAKTGAQSASEKANPKQKTAGMVPPILDFLFTFSRILMVLVGLVAAALSLAGGSNPLQAGLRAGVGMVIVGFIMYLVSWVVSRGALDSYKAQKKRAEDEIKKAEQESATMELQA